MTEVFLTGRGYIAVVVSQFVQPQVLCPPPEIHWGGITEILVRNELRHVTMYVVWGIKKKKAWSTDKRAPGELVRNVGSVSVSRLSGGMYPTPLPGQRNGRPSRLSAPSP